MDLKLPTASQIIATAYTTDVGTYSVTAPVALGQRRDVTVRARSATGAATIHAVGTPASYIVESARFDNKGDGDQFVADITSVFGSIPNSALSVSNAVFGGWEYVLKVSKSQLPSLFVEFPTTEQTSCMKAGELHILDGDRYDWDVILHEFGHYVSSQYSLDKSLGGNHNLGENLEDRLDKPTAIRLAWGEGWPTYFSIVSQLDMNMSSMQIPYVGDARYTDTEDMDPPIDLSLESNGDGSLGEDNEVSVMRLLFDTATDKNGVNLSSVDLWQILVDAKPETLSDALTALSSKQMMRNLVLIGVNTTKHHVASGLTQPLSQANLSPDPPTFIWVPNGAGNKHPNDEFKVSFFDEQMSLLAESPLLSSASFTPTSELWAKLKASQVAFWMVSSSNTVTPKTGPYLSSPSALVSKPP